MAKTMLPQFNENDVLYIYKEQCFTGFAPCLFHNLFTLACCKGDKKRGGLRASACRQFEKNEKEKNIWILSIAGKHIKDKDHNKSGFDYNPGDAIYLAKVMKTMSWSEYSTKFEYSHKETDDENKRRDAIYFCKGNKIFQHKNEDHGEECMATDCALKSSDPWDKKQIIVSSEYYLLKPDMKLNYRATRNFIYKGLTTKELANEAIRHPEKFLYRHNPFKDQSKDDNNTGCNTCGGRKEK